MSGDFPDFPDLGIDTWGAILLEPPPPPGERDFKVICGGRTFNLHSKLLVNQSKFFAEMLLIKLALKIDKFALNIDKLAPITLH